MLIIAVILAAAFLIVRNFLYRPQIASAALSDGAVAETAKGLIGGSEDNGIYPYLGDAFCGETASVGSLWQG